MPTSVHGQPQYCSGRTSGYWKQPQKFSEWPSPYLPVPSAKKPATLFKTAIFPAPVGPYPTQTMLQVLEMGSGPPDNLGRHLTASILNVKKGWAPVLTLELLKAIWTQYINTGGGITGFFEPTAGVKWYHDQIVEYLITTMTG